MTRILPIIISMALATAASAQEQVETIDTALFVAVYDYECRTLNEESAPITDRMQVALQVGRTVTKSMPMKDYLQCIDLWEEPKTDVTAGFQEAYMHMPTVWTGLATGQTTVREYIFPHDYEGYEPTPGIAWTLTEDTMTVSGYLCKQATAVFRGVEWHVCYSEDIPSTTGPWRLRGLPGLIVRAESEAHTFTLEKLRSEASPITAPEKEPDVLRMKYAKFLRHKNEIYGNRQYVKNPIYYVPNPNGSISHMEVYHFGGQSYVYANGHPLLTKAHVYKPLEME